MPELGGITSNSNAAKEQYYDEQNQNKTTQSIFGESFDQGVKRFGSYLKKKGWVKEEDVDAANAVTTHSSSGITAGDVAGSRTETTVVRINEQKGVKLVLEFATAYAITKVLLPVRIAISVWATPWFARAVLVPVGRGFKGLLGR
jgi:hypothetical protein